jgi:hypothetical protein
MFGAEVKNECSHASIPCICLHGVDTDNFTIAAVLNATLPVKCNRKGQRRLWGWLEEAFPKGMARAVFSHWGTVVDKSYNDAHITRRPLLLLLLLLLLLIIVIHMKTNRHCPNSV